VASTQDVEERLKAALADRYEIQRKIGEGGMAKVFLARDLKHDRKVAVKELRPELSAAVGSERFLREIKITAGLNHPHILPLLDSGEADGCLYYVMPYVDGESLRERLTREKQLPLEDALQILEEVAGALGHAHGLGVIHRDIKPENILLSGGTALIADFGIAKAIDARGSEHLTETGLAVGTPAYMSPEQAGGEDVDGRSDIYSLACVAYELLGGQPPFTGPSPQAILARHSVDPVPPLRTIRPRAPRGATDAIEKALAKVPADRFTTAEEFGNALRVAGEGPGLLGLGQAPAARRWLMAGAAAVLAVVAVFSAWLNLSAPAGTPRLLVLPFENLGPQEDDYFTAGITEVVTVRLAGISGLGVISRNAAMQYANTSLTPSEIGQALGVDYILAGSVQRERSGDDGGRVRITPHLIKTADDTNVWAEVYDDLMSGVFALQSDIAERVASVLQVTVLEPERRQLQAPLTQVSQAYELYLTALGYSGIRAEESSVGVQLLEQAVRLDSTFAAAYALLGNYHSAAVLYGFDRTPERLAMAKAAVDRALEISPDLPAAHRSLGLYYLRGHRDYERALQEFTLAAEGLPNDDALLTDIAFLQRRQGAVSEAALALERAAVLNPRSFGLRWQLGLTLGMLGRYQEAASHFEESLTLGPDSREAHVMGALNYLAWDGDGKRARATLERMPEGVDPERQAVFGWYEIHSAEGTYGEFLEWLDRCPVEVFHYQQDLMPKSGLRAMTYRRMGDAAKAGAYADSARAWLEGQLEASPNDPRLHKSLGLMHAVLGNREQAVREGERAVELEPVARDAVVGPFHEMALAEILVMVGEHGAALERLDHLLSVAGGFVVSPARLRSDPRWEPLRGHPGFQALLERNP